MSLDDDSVLAAFKDVAAVDAPSPFHTARAARNLDAAIDADVRARSRWTMPRVAAVAFAGAVAGALAVLLVVRPAPPPPTLPGTSEAGAALASSAALASGALASSAALASSPGALASTPGALAATPGALASSSGAPLASPGALAASPGALAATPGALASSPRASTGVPAPGSVGRARAWRDEAQVLIDAGDGVGAARIFVRALEIDPAAGPALALLAHRFPDALEAVDAELANVKSAEAMRMRCEQKLLHSRNRTALEACRAFGLEHPENPGARTLAFAAGRLAEDLDDLPAAEEAYSRALLLSPFVGMPGTDALLARARVREAAGDVDDARADLRLYLANEGRDDPAVAALAQRLGL